MIESLQYQRLRRWARPPRRLTLTAAGKFFILLTLAVGLGAINTGNNLLFLLMGMLLSLIIASGILSEGVLRGLRANRRLPPRAFAGQDASGTYVLKNGATRAAFSVEVADLNAIPIAGPLARHKVIGIRRHAWWKFWKREQLEGQPLANAYLIRVAPQAVVELEAQVKFPTRGLYELRTISVLTRFPFGLFEKSREFDEDFRILIEPTPVDEASWHGVLAAKLGEVDAFLAGAGEEYFGLRAFREGEDARQIHWKSSARRGSLLVRETQRRLHRRVIVRVLDRVPKVTPEAEQAFELGISRAAGLIHRLQLGGYTVGDGPDDATATLDHLAVVELTEGQFELEPPPLGFARIVLGLQSSLDQANLVPDDIAFAFDEVG